MGLKAIKIRDAAGKPQYRNGINESPPAEADVLGDSGFGFGRPVVLSWQNDQDRKGKGLVAGLREPFMKLKLVAAVSALAIPALAHAEQSGPQPAVPKPTKADAQKVVQIITSDKVAQNSAADADIDEDFSIISGLSGGPTSYLDGIKKMPWVLKLLDQCGLDEQHIRGSATSAIMRTKLGFVSDEDVRDFFERPLFQLIVTALPASSGCAASISARVIAPIEGARFVYDKKPLQKPTYVTIWEDTYGEGGRAIYEPHEQITARIEASIDTLINEFAEAWTHSQGIGHPKYGAP